MAPRPKYNIKDDYKRAEKEMGSMGVDKRHHTVLRRFGGSYRTGSRTYFWRGYLSRITFALFGNDGTTVHNKERRDEKWETGGMRYRDTIIFISGLLLLIAAVDNWHII